MNQLINQLTSNGYEVKTGNTGLHGGSLTHWLYKITGETRRDISGGYISLLENGTYGFDLFNGGDKYGDHFNSFTEDTSEVDHLPEEEIINFLN